MVLAERRGGESRTFRNTDNRPTPHPNVTTDVGRTVETGSVIRLSPQISEVYGLPQEEKESESGGGRGGGGPKGPAIEMAWRTQDRLTDAGSPSAHSNDCRTVERMSSDFVRISSPLSPCLLEKTLQNECPTALDRHGHDSHGVVSSSLSKDIRNDLFSPHGNLLMTMAFAESPAVSLRTKDQSFPMKQEENEEENKQEDNTDEEMRALLGNVLGPHPRTGRRPTARPAWVETPSSAHQVVVRMLMLSLLSTRGSGSSSSSSSRSLKAPVGQEEKRQCPPSEILSQASSSSLKPYRREFEPTSIPLSQSPNRTDTEEEKYWGARSDENADRTLSQCSGEVFSELVVSSRRSSEREGKPVYSDALSGTKDSLHGDAGLHGGASSASPSLSPGKTSRPHNTGGVSTWSPLLALSTRSTSYDQQSTSEARLPVSSPVRDPGEEGKEEGEARPQLPAVGARGIFPTSFSAARDVITKDPPPHATASPSPTAAQLRQFILKAGSLDAPPSVSESKKKRRMTGQSDIRPRGEACFEEPVVGPCSTLEPHTETEYLSVVVGTASKTLKEGSDKRGGAAGGVAAEDLVEACTSPAKRSTQEKDEEEQEGGPPSPSTHVRNSSGTSHIEPPREGGESDRSQESEGRGRYEGDALLTSPGVRNASSSTTQQRNTGHTRKENAVDDTPRVSPPVRLRGSEALLPDRLLSREDEQVACTPLVCSGVQQEEPREGSLSVPLLFPFLDTTAGERAHLLSATSPFPSGSSPSFSSPACSSSVIDASPSVGPTLAKGERGALGETTQITSASSPRSSPPPCLPSFSSCPSPTSGQAGDGPSLISDGLRSTRCTLSSPLSLLLRLILEDKRACHQPSTAIGTDAFSLRVSEEHEICSSVSTSPAPRVESFSSSQTQSASVTLGAGLMSSSRLHHQPLSSRTETPQDAVEKHTLLALPARSLHKDRRSSSVSTSDSMPFASPFFTRASCSHFLEGPPPAAADLYPRAGRPADCGVTNDDGSDQSSVNNNEASPCRSAGARDPLSNSLDFFLSSSSSGCHASEERKKGRFPNANSPKPFPQTAEGNAGLGREESKQSAVKPRVLWENSSIALSPSKKARVTAQGGPTSLLCTGGGGRLQHEAESSGISGVNEPCRNSRSGTSSESSIASHSILKAPVLPLPESPGGLEGERRTGQQEMNTVEIRSLFSSCFSSMVAATREALDVSHLGYAEGHEELEEESTEKGRRTMIQARDGGERHVEDEEEEEAKGDSDRVVDSFDAQKSAVVPLRRIGTRAPTRGKDVGSGGSGTGDVYSGSVPKKIDPGTGLKGRAGCDDTTGQKEKEMQAFREKSDTGGGSSPVNKEAFLFLLLGGGGGRGQKRGKEDDGQGRKRNQEESTGLHRTNLSASATTTTTPASTTPCASSRVDHLDQLQGGGDPRRDSEDDNRKEIESVLTSHRGIRNSRKLESYPAGFEVARSTERTGSSCRSVGKKEFECVICSAVFTRDDHLRLHQRTVHGAEKPFACPLCQKTFRYNRGNLEQHIQAVHKGIKPFECKICKKTFSQKGNLGQHIRAVHAGKKPFQCSECLRAFSRKSHLNRHIESLGHRRHASLPSSSSCPFSANTDDNDNDQ